MKKIIAVFGEKNGRSIQVCAVAAPVSARSVRVYAERNSITITSAWVIDEKPLPRDITAAFMAAANK